MREIISYEAFDGEQFLHKKEFEVDGYKGVGTKEILYHLKDFEKVWFVEKWSSKKR